MKASIQEQLAKVLAELESDGRDPAAAAIRRVAISPESQFATGSEWLFGVMEAADDVSAIAPELKTRLEEIKSRAHAAIYT